MFLFLSLITSNLAFISWLALLMDLFALFIPDKGLKIDWTMFLFLSLIPLTKFLLMSLIPLIKFFFVSFIPLITSNLAFRRWLVLLMDLFPLLISDKGLKIDLTMFLFLSLIPLTKFLFMFLIPLIKFLFVSFISLTTSNLAFRRWLALLMDLFPLLIPAKGLKIDLTMFLFASLILLTKPNLVVGKSDLKLITTGLMIPFLVPRLSF